MELDIVFSRDDAMADSRLRCVSSLSTRKLQELLDSIEPIYVRGSCIYSSDL